MKIAAISLITAASALFAPSAAGPPSQCQADQERATREYLHKFPGGTVTAPGVISYDGGATIVRIWPKSCGADFSIGCAGDFICFWADRQQRTVIVQHSATSRWIRLAITDGFNYVLNNRARVTRVKTSGRDVCLAPHEHRGNPDVRTMSWKKIYLSTSETRCG